ncbi:MAG: hypothetical protein EXR75_12520 [Myxococcales bacterium]|nr:hypothetical protein [Myxococcales bacterium]
MSEPELDVPERGESAQSESAHNESAHNESAQSESAHNESAQSVPEREDLEPGDVRAHEALGRFRITRVTTAEGPAFDEAYEALDGEFGARGELERRSVLEGWLDAQRSGKVGDLAIGSARDLAIGAAGDLAIGAAGDLAIGSAGDLAIGAAGDLAIGSLRDASGALLAWQYDLLVARDEHGGLAGVRDAHVTIDREKRECVVYLAHTLVLPAFRRGGLASLFRAAPITLARRAIARAGLDRGACDLLIAAEMEPGDPDDRATLVRLIAYGRAGFAVVPPSLLPYCQPDFRDLARTNAAARPLPLLAVVRWLGHAGQALPARLAESYARHLYAVFATHCRPAELARPLAHALECLRGAPRDSVPLLPLPTSLDDAAALTPLVRAEVLRHHLPELREPASP